MVLKFKRFRNHPLEPEALEVEFFPMEKVSLPLSNVTITMAMSSDCKIRLPHLEAGNITWKLNVNRIVFDDCGIHFFY